MSSYPLPTLAASITPAGISAPALSDIIGSTIASVQSIFGSDIVLDPSSQDYQMLAIMVTAINDANNALIQLYNGLLPTYAQGVFLSALVKINGISRNVGSNSTAPCEVVGTVGLTINFGVVQDSAGNLWDLPQTVTIPAGGSIVVTATAESEGAISAVAGAVNIFSPVIRGWNSASFTADSTPGAPVESDGALRQRQTISTSLPSQTPSEAILSNVANVAGVTRYAIYVNDTANTDANGLPSHSISLVVLGGTAADIALAIEEKKAPGTGTYGSTQVIVQDPAGVPDPINFFVLSLVQVYVVVNVTPLNGWVASTVATIQAAIADFISALAIGTDVYYDWILGPATLYGSNLEFSFKVSSLTIGFSAGAQGTADLAILFNQAAQCVAANVVVNVA